MLEYLALEVLFSIVFFGISIVVTFVAALVVVNPLKRAAIMVAGIAGNYLWLIVLGAVILDRIVPPMSTMAYWAVVITSVYFLGRFIASRGAGGRTGSTSKVSAVRGATDSWSDPTDLNHPLHMMRPGSPLNDTLFHSPVTPQDQ